MLLPPTISMAATICWRRPAALAQSKRRIRVPQHRPRRLRRDEKQLQLVRMALLRLVRNAGVKRMPVPAAVAVHRRQAIVPRGHVVAVEDRLNRAGAQRRIAKPRRIASARRHTMIRSSTLVAICVTIGSTETALASVRRSRRRSPSTFAASVSTPGTRRSCTASAVSLTTNLNSTFAVISARTGSTDGALEYCNARQTTLTSTYARIATRITRSTLPT